MTDRDTLIAMLERAKITTQVAGEIYGKYREIDLLVERGYTSFYTVFTFHDDGSLRNVEAYE
jgi:hypothetical protein